MRKFTFSFKSLLVAAGLLLGSANAWADATVQHFGSDEQIIWQTESGTTDNILHGSTVTLNGLVMTFGGSTSDDKWVWIGDKNKGVVSNMPNTGSSTTGVTSVAKGDKVPACGGTYKFVPSTTGVLSIGVKGGGKGTTDGAGYLYLVTVDESKNNEITEIVSSKEGYATATEEKYHLIAGNTYYFFQCAISPSHVTSGRLTLKYISYQTSVSVTVSDAGWATLFTDKALDFSGVTGLQAYTAAVDGDNIVLTEVANVPANTGVVLKGDENTYIIPVIASSETAKGDLTGNVSAATACPAPTNHTYYILTKDGDEKAQFNPATSGEIAPGKAFLDVTTGGGIKVFNVIVDGTATGVEAPVAAEAAVEDGVYYNLNGQQVTKDYKGIVIVNGKKFLNK